MQEIEAALRAMLGSQAGIGVTSPKEPPSGLWPVEAVAMTRAIPKRRAEFAAGRRAARAAMDALDLPAAAIPQGPDRAPQWPAGLIGSIAHCDTLCIAVVAQIGTYRSIGIDIEPATALDADLNAIVCSPAERDWMAKQPDPGLAAKIVFGAKEAVYKAQYPLTGAVIGFQEVTLVFTGEQFTAQTGLNIPQLTGAIAIHRGLILSYATV